jgi:hypothetical protein
LPNRSSFRSKSDTCLHKITPPTSAACPLSKLVVDSDTKKTSFSAKFAHVLASFVVTTTSTNQENTFCGGDSISSNSSNDFVGLSPEKLRPNTTTLSKTNSLERNTLYCKLSAEAREQARRTRSLERNHRHLVTIDSSCR